MAHGTKPPQCVPTCAPTRPTVAPYPTLHATTRGHLASQGGTQPGLGEATPENRSTGCTGCHGACPPGLEPAVAHDIRLATAGKQTRLHHGTQDPPAQAMARAFANRPLLCWHGPKSTRTQPEGGMCPWAVTSGRDLGRAFQNWWHGVLSQMATDAKMATDDDVTLHSGQLCQYIHVCIPHNYPSLIIRSIGKMTKQLWAGPRDKRYPDHPFAVVSSRAPPGTGELLRPLPAATPSTTR